MLNKVNTSNQHKLIKCMVIGDSPSGKTTITHALAQLPIADYYAPSIGMELKTTLLEYNNCKIKLRIADCSGNERYQYIATSWYRDSDFILYMLDLTKQSQLSNIPKRLKEIKENCHHSIPIILVGNIPLFAERHIKSDDIQDLVKQHSLTYLELNIYNHDEVRQILNVALKKLYWKIDDEDFADGGSITFLMPEEELNRDLPLYTKTGNEIIEYINHIPKINALITRSTLYPKNNATCYSAKLTLMQNIFSHDDLFLKLDLLPDLFVQYMDAIGGVIRHFGNLTNKDSSTHLSLLIRFFERMNNNPHFQAEIIDNIDRYHQSTPNQFFPNDNTFHPLIMCKLLGWMQKRPLIKHLTAFYRLPYTGQHQQFMKHIIEEMQLSMIACFKNKQNDYEKTVTEYINALQNYYIIQKRFQTRHPIQLHELELFILKALRHGIPPHEISDSVMWINLKKLEEGIETASIEAKSLFFAELDADQGEAESDTDYLHRKALSSFLKCDFSTDSVNIFIMKSINNYLIEFSEIKNKKELYIQKAIDLLYRYKRLTDRHLSLSPDQLKILSLAFSQVVDSIHLIATDNDIPAEDLVILLTEVALKHWNVAKQVACIQKLMAIQNELAQSLCSHIVAYYMEPIADNEHYEIYLERLCAAASLFAIYEPIKQHYYARMILLTNAEEIIQRTPAEHSLTAKDFQVEYRNLAISPETALIEFIASRQGMYLRALCRCYRQTVSIAVSRNKLIQQYLVVLLEAQAISTDNLELIKNILEEQITVNELILLIQSLSRDYLQLLTKHHVDSILKGLYKNASELCANLNTEHSLSSITLLLDCVPTQCSSELSNIVFKILTETLPNLVDTPYLQPGLDIVACFISKGASVFHRQMLGPADNPTSTHAIISLLKSKQHTLLINFLELFRHNPENIIDNGFNDYIGENPLFLAISNNGNRRLIALMLELGFSSEFVYAHLAEEHDANMIEEAKKLVRNNEALLQLCLFQHKTLRSSSVIESNLHIRK